MAKAKETKAETTILLTAEGQIVVSVQADDGTTHYAWRKDGTKPEVNMEDFARNKHAALIPHGTANFASNVKP